MTGRVARTWEDVAVGDALSPISFPLSLYRLVVVAGANRDFNSIHHNSEYARATGAADAYANTLFLQGMWERAVREFIGDGGTIRAIRGFRMRSFTLVGDTAVVEGEVSRHWLEDDHGDGFVELTLRTRSSTGITVGPGTVVATMPRAG
ncbi:MAG: acyl dehydratase [Blastococcus sp.]|jgi:acyl dehydratase|nr:acyl dehydratase [Blastococcus sp.]